MTAVEDGDEPAIVGRAAERYRWHLEAAQMACDGVLEEVAVELAPPPLRRASQRR
ncbi:MAG: hypothetical protein M3Q22_02980 [Actinomycetota bacterium]|nr:hypothetical protein [Actinomycetota bacterium]MDP9459242.1 hypothetical protein [Actinomycetota bacterium]